MPEMFQYFNISLTAKSNSGRSGSLLWSHMQPQSWVPSVTKPSLPNNINNVCTISSLLIWSLRADIWLSSYSRLDNGRLASTQTAFLIYLQLVCASIHKKIPDTDQRGSVFSHRKKAMFYSIKGLVDDSCLKRFEKDGVGKCSPEWGHTKYDWQCRGFIFMTHMLWITFRFFIFFAQAVFD